MYLLDLQQRIVTERATFGAENKSFLARQSICPPLSIATLKQNIEEKNLKTEIAW